jgi:gamma-glutamylaminecyclotransferase
MVVGGSRYAPMMFDEPGVGYHVVGELYRIDDELLASLDRLESIGSPGNLRVIIDILVSGYGEPLPVVAYLKARYLAVPLHTDYLEDYQDDRFTGLASATKVAEQKMNDAE